MPPAAGAGHNEETVMSHRFAEIAFTDAVKAVQEQYRV